jgi:dihydroneopterin aldolase
MDWITLTDLRFDAIVGILASEQARAQPLELEVKMALDLDGAGSTGDLSKSVNYAAVANQVRFMAQQGRWRLIESLGTGICRLLLAPPAPQEARAAIERVELRIRKPTILDGLAVPGVTMRRTADWCKIPKSKAPSRTTIEQLEATPLSGAWRIHVDGGTSWQPTPSVALYVIAGRPRVNGVTVEPGTEIARAAGLIENRQSDPVTLLAVGAPSKQKA